MRSWITVLGKWLPVKQQELCLWLKRSKTADQKRLRHLSEVCRSLFFVAQGDERLRCTAG